MHGCRRLYAVCCKQSGHELDGRAIAFDATKHCAKRKICTLWIPVTLFEVFLFFARYSQKCVRPSSNVGPKLK
jgi:hypothetical protein